MHTAELGSGNYTIMYVELLGILTATDNVIRLQLNLAPKRESASRSANGPFSDFDQCLS
jgi:hypothetical protein